MCVCLQRNAYENVNCYAWGNLISSSRKQKIKLAMLVDETTKREWKKKLWLQFNFEYRQQKNVHKLTAKVVYQLLNSSHRRWRNVNAYHFDGFSAFFSSKFAIGLPILTDIQLIIIIVYIVNNNYYLILRHILKVFSILKCNKKKMFVCFSLLFNRSINSRFKMLFGWWWISWKSDG